MKNRLLIFKFRIATLFDVLFSDKFELTTFDKSGQQKSKTKFDKQEILTTKLS